MKLAAEITPKVFQFKQPSGTSRGVLTEKKAWFITVWEQGDPSTKGTGECSVIPRLSPDYKDDSSYEKKLQEVVEHIDYYANFTEQLWRFPSIRFGVEMALLDLKNGGKKHFFDTPFSQGKAAIKTNGLIWMGEEAFMQQQIEEKIAQNFSCIKMKIGALDFDKELGILTKLRERFPHEKLDIRVDANGNFSVDEAEEKLKALAPLQLHSIEQPIKQGQPLVMQKLSETELVPIALDEELIGVYEYEKKKQLLTAIKPHFIILKPSLLGGFKETDEWIKLAGQMNIPWWITSALESNIGLNAIAQYTSKFSLTRAQGLGTGSLYTNNIDSGLLLRGEELYYKV